MFLIFKSFIKSRVSKQNAKAPKINDTSVLVRGVLLYKGPTGTGLRATFSIHLRVPFEHSPNQWRASFPTKQLEVVCALFCSHIMQLNNRLERMLTSAFIYLVNFISRHEFWNVCRMSTFGCKSSMGNTWDWILY